MQRPAPEELRCYQLDFEDSLEVTWTEAANVTDPRDVSIAVGPELTRDATRIRYLATATFMFTGTHAILLDIRRGPASEDDAGTCELGPVMTSIMGSELEWYEHGADLVALRDAGFRLSWEAAQWLYDVGRVELDELHAGGRAVADARKIRLRLFHSPFSPSRKHPGAYHNDGSNTDLSDEWPAAFAFVGRARNGAHDHALLAAAIADLTQHPDPAIEQLLHDPESAAVLRDLLLERGQPIERLLRDLTNAIGLAPLPLVDRDGIDDEFAALWDKVVELDPMMDAPPRR